MSSVLQMLEMNKWNLFAACVRPAHVHSQGEPYNLFNEKIRQLLKRALEHKLLLWRQMARLNKHIINGGIHHFLTLCSEIGHLCVLPALSYRLMQTLELQWCQWNISCPISFTRAMWAFLELISHTVTLFLAKVGFFFICGRKFLVRTSYFERP